MTVEGKSEWMGKKMPSNTWKPVWSRDYQTIHKK